MGTMAVIRKLTGETVEDIERELAKLNEQAAALAAEIDRHEAQEAEAEHSDLVLAAMAEGRAARNRLTKLDGRIAETRERLAVAKDAARARLRDQLLANFAAAAAEFLAAARATGVAFGRLIAARDALQAAGFDREHAGLPIPPAIGRSPLLTPELLEKFEAALRPAASIPRVQPRRPIEVKSAAARGGLGGPVTLGPAAKRQPRPAKRARIRETPAEGEVLFLMHRGIVPHPRAVGRMIETGDAIALTPDEATPLIRRRLGDVISAKELEQFDAASGLSARPAEGA